ncbi:MAG: ribbon-helix-helix domain-containing protein [Alphaproteobacteria bacterium]|nr:ribbon-helix-helix domain-containing protein [Alphaproteobacteria bacterium]MBQ8347275.1 ribbon-helix-helix domain-containing protein [Alphaproteobacteria bacterium]
MSIRKYSVMIAGHRTSVSLEPEFWEELKKLAARRNLTPAELITRIDADRKGSLSSELRLYVLRALTLRD